MYSGEISGNTAKNLGGAVHLDIGSLTMKGGSISGNTGGTGTVMLWSASRFTMEGGVIAGNTSAGAGGAVYLNIDQNNNFIKKGGIIYGDTDTSHTPDSTENTSARGMGHAVFVKTGWDYNHPGKQRNADTGPEVLLYASSNGGTASWTFADTSEDGLGDTSANWQ
jgi:hypothetical protein